MRKQAEEPQQYYEKTLNGGDIQSGVILSAMNSKSPNPQRSEE